VIQWLAYVYLIQEIDLEIASTKATGAFAISEIAANGIFVTIGDDDEGNE
jgi:hypothetical protein